MSKPLILTSPKGRAIFPHLTEPDTKFKPEGEYHVKLECNKADCEKIVKQIKDFSIMSQKNTTSTQPFPIGTSQPYNQKENLKN